jgi:hypothetical protein
MGRIHLDIALSFLVLKASPLMRSARSSSVLHACKFGAIKVGVQLWILAGDHEVRGSSGDAARIRSQIQFLTRLYDMTAYQLRFCLSARLVDRPESHS